MAEELQSDEKMSQSETRVETVAMALVDSNPTSRANLAQVVQTSRFRIVAQPSQVEHLPEKLFGECNINLILIAAGDVGAKLPRINSLKEQHTELRVVVLGDRLGPSQVLSFLKAGADGILIKNESDSEALISALELVLLGKPIVQLRIVEVLKAQLRRERLESEAAPGENPVQQHEERDQKVTVSTRERAVLLHLVRGASNARIARELNVAEATIQVHLRSLFRKVRTSNRTSDRGPDVTSTRSGTNKFVSSFNLPADARRAANSDPLRSVAEVPSAEPLEAGHAGPIGTAQHPMPRLI
jgi:two-component system, NarL family, nitrate/nitrite response regulator NarL